MLVAYPPCKLVRERGERELVTLVKQGKVVALQKPPSWVKATADPDWLLGEKRRLDQGRAKRCKGTRFRRLKAAIAGAEIPTEIAPTPSVSNQKGAAGKGRRRQGDDREGRGHSACPGISVLIGISALVGSSVALYLGMSDPLSNLESLTKRFSQHSRAIIDEIR